MGLETMEIRWGPGGAPGLPRRVWGLQTHETREQPGLGATGRGDTMPHLHPQGQEERENLHWCCRGKRVGHRGPSPPRGAPPGQPHARAPRSPHQALTHAGDLGEEQEKIISGVERQIQGKGLEELNRARASKGECRAGAGGPAGAERGAGQRGAPPPHQP